MASSSASVFIYGSLLAEEVLALVLRRIPTARKAILRNYRRCSLRNRIYPGAVYSQGSRINGKVLLDLTKSELQSLDEFEGEEYKRLGVESLLVEDYGSEVHGIPMDAFVYVWKGMDESDQSDLLGEWDYEQWRRTQMESFLEECS